MHRLRKMRSGLSCQSNFHERQKTGYQPEDLHSLFLLPGILPEGSNESRENDSNEDRQKDHEIGENIGKNVYLMYAVANGIIRGTKKPVTRW